MGLCENLAAGASPTEIKVLDSANRPRLVVPLPTLPLSTLTDLATWKSFRENNGASVRIFIYNGDGLGEELTYTGEKIYDASDTEITGTPTAGQVASASLEVTVTGTLTK